MPELLDLTAVFDRDTVKLPDGTTCELRNPQEFGVVADYKLRALLQEILQSAKAETNTEEEAEKASSELRSLATLLVVDPTVEIDDWSCVAIFEFWMNKHGEEPSKDPPKPRRSTTAASSRGSKPSTAATRKHGSSTSPRGR